MSNAMTRRSWFRAAVAAALLAACASACGTYRVGLRLGGGRTPPPTDPDRVQLFAETDLGRSAEALALVVGSAEDDGEDGVAEALENIRAAAARYGADAVVGVTARVDQIRLTLTGVAVRLDRDGRRAR